jgi:hypothetical protein
MPLIVFAVALAVGLTLAPLAADAQQTFSGSCQAIIP